MTSHGLPALPSAGECLAPYVVRDTLLAPDLLPGDRLITVTCEQVSPRLGEFVLLQASQGGRHELMRFIAPSPGRRNRPASILVWSGSGYRRVPAQELRGRVLTVVRGGKSHDLRVAHRSTGRNRLAILGHRFLGRVHHWLEASEAQGPSARDGQ